MKKFCSKECAKTHREIISESQRKPYVIEERNCEVCGAEFSTRSNRTNRFCSSTCYNKRLSEHDKICKNCGITFRPKAKSAGLFCSKACYFEDCGKRQKEKFAKLREGKPQKESLEEKRARMKAVSEEKKSINTIRRRHEIAVRLNLFRIHKNVKKVSELLSEKTNTTRWFLRDSPAYLRYIDGHNSWRARELLYGMTSKKYRLESHFCEDLHRIIQAAGYPATREKTIDGKTDRRIDLVAAHIFGTYGIEAKNTNKAQKADQCLGQAVIKCHVMGYIPVCAFPSDCMPDAVFMHVARDMGVRIVNELTICNELFGGVET